MDRGRGTLRQRSLEVRVYDRFGRREGRRQPIMKSGSRRGIRCLVGEGCRCRIPRSDPARRPGKKMSGLRLLSLGHGAERRDDPPRLCNEKPQHLALEAAVVERLLSEKNEIHRSPRLSNVRCR